MGKDHEAPTINLRPEGAGVAETNHRPQEAGVLVSRTRNNHHRKSDAAA